jgi:DNA-binding transcriptional regulator GbsR (MarR family)
MKKPGLPESRDHFVQAVSRIASFWGFPRAMGAIYGAIYLSPEPVGLDELVQLVGVSKGSVSTNARTLERLQMIHKRVKLGDRRDYYEAETDFWKIVRGVLKEREKSEFDRALRAVGESLEMAENVGVPRSGADLGTFYVRRIGSMKSFFDALDGIVVTLLALDDLRLRTFQKMLGKGGKKARE